MTLATKHRCDHAPDTCERHKSACCVLKGVRDAAEQVSPGENL